MSSNLFEGLQTEVRNKLRAVIEAARKEGWDVREVRVDSGIVTVSATSLAGGFHFACLEAEVPERLRALLLKAKEREPAGSHEAAVEFESEKSINSR